jgi:hypothetical protein
MNKYQEETHQEYENLFNENDFSFGQIAIQNGEVALLKQESEMSEGFADKILKGVKYLFFFTPGVFLLTLIGPGLFLSILYPSFVESLLGLLVCGGIGSFLTMLGMGKLKDLKYLKVPAFIALCSMIVGFLFFPPAFYFGYELNILKFFLPFTIVLGYLVKRNIDKSEETD